MDRKKFLKNILLSGVAGSIAPQIIKKAEDHTLTGGVSFAFFYWNLKIQLCHYML